MSVSLRFDHDGSLKIYTWKGQEISLSKPVVDAIREYFARPKALTPRERAESLAQRYFSSITEQYDDLAREVAAAIEDAARRGVDWEEDNGH